MDQKLPKSKLVITLVSESLLILVLIVNTAETEMISIAQKELSRLTKIPRSMEEMEETKISKLKVDTQNHIQCMNILS